MPCHLRGRFRKAQRGFRVVAGDRVQVEPPAAQGAHGTIEGMEPRSTWLSRYVGGRERVIVANIDTLVVMASVRKPRLSFGFLDRILVAAEQGNNRIHICLNKMDLQRHDEARIEEFTDVYSSIGYPLIRTSTRTGEGIEAVRGLIQGGVYAFVGQSGVGKSSLLNLLDESLDLRVGGVAKKTGRGRHTTTFSQLYPIHGGYVADTPGMQTFGFPGTDVADLSRCFPEFRDFEKECRFQPCTHVHEPDCEVKLAVERGGVFPSRYQSYRDMLAEVEEREKSRFS